MDSARPAFFGPMLVVRDFESALQFYRNVIGMEGDGESPYAEFVSNSCKLVLLDHAFWKTVGGHGGPTPRAWKREGVVLAVQVKNVDEEYRRIKAKGVAIASPPSDRPMMGLRNFQVFDPDGNLVELTSPLKKQPPSSTTGGSRPYPVANPARSAGYETSPPQVGPGECPATEKP